MDERPTEDESDDARLEQLETEIVRLKRIVEQMLPQNEFTRALAEQQQLLESKIVEKELILERRRVAAVARHFEEEYPQPEGEECPICFESMPTHLVEGGVVILICCGKFICSTCGRNEAIDRCPLCRAVVHAEDQETKMKLLLKHAERGIGWAELTLGSNFDHMANTADTVDMKRDYEEKALQWYRRAASKGVGAAERRLGGKFFAGASVVVSRSYEDAYRWHKAAAIHGDYFAQVCLGMAYADGLGVEQNDVEAVYWMTNAISRGREPSHFAELRLGLWFQNGQGGLPVSLRLSTYYLEMAASASIVTHAVAQYSLAVALWNHTVETYGSWLIPGYSCAPRVLYLMRKSLANGYAEAAARIDDIESILKGYCANCKVIREDCAQELRSCETCMAAWYCGEKCQEKHWEDGHEIDCCSGSD